ncbi:hypothetical protein [Bacillus sp. NEB1478]|uniref:hypothetical protein n=1 Tax=Bacillus sp. NEB1478 TaxID=3073816 RepID=UPI0028730427|nr:hypothetical protein [Bacillus sp. NEB1478]WNB93482.1 hypothetical protein RGB74_07380 [Bacillus sp. NEB1478]
MKILEAVIDLLLSNIAFVIIVAGGIFSFIKRMNESKATHRTQTTQKMMEKPKQTVSPFGSQAGLDRHSPEPITNQKETNEKKNNIYSRYNEKQENISRNRYHDKERDILSSLSVDQSELKKAVIWSEILSKPKALQKRS